MKKTIQKHIDKKHYVKVHISDKDSSEITNFDGILLQQNKDFIIMTDTTDFQYDGIVILKKEDVSEIVRGDNQRYFDKIFTKEGYKSEALKFSNELNFKIGTIKEMFNQLLKLKIPVIIEQRYNDNAKFQIGPITAVTKKSTYIHYFSAAGVYNLSTIKSNFKDITYFRFDDPYSTLMHKYAKKLK